MFLYLQNLTNFPLNFAGFGLLVCGFWSMKNMLIMYIFMPILCPKKHADSDCLPSKHASPHACPPESVQAC